jgi:hypothetical protein
LSDSGGILSLLDNGTTVGLLNVAIPYSADLFISPDGSGGDDLHVLPAGSGYTINDTVGTIIARANTSFSLAGGHDTVGLASGDYLGLLGASGYSVVAVSATINTTANTSFNLGGGNDRVQLAAGDYLGLVGGSGNTVYGTGGGDTIATTANTGFQPGWQQRHRGIDCGRSPDPIRWQWVLGQIPLSASARALRS